MVTFWKILHVSEGFTAKTVIRYGYILYNRVVEPMIRYGSLLWWPKTQQSPATKSLFKIQQAACVGLLGAMKGTQKASIDVLLCFFPQKIFSLRGRQGWQPTDCSQRYHQASKYRRIGDILQIYIFDWMSDRITSKLDLDIPFSVEFLDKNE